MTRTGVAFKAARLSQISFLLRAVRDWKARPAAERRARSPAAETLKDWLRAVPADGGQSQREALLHLLCPEAFEAIVSMAIKQRVVDAFTEHVEAGAGDVDAALVEIRSALEPEHGAGFWFTDPALMERWTPEQ